MSNSPLHALSLRPRRLRRRQRTPQHSLLHPQSIASRRRILQSSCRYYCLDQLQPTVPLRSVFVPP